MSIKTGTISVNTHDILPIVKKWLYSEHDIFLRELVSNSSDAISKRQIVCRNKNQEIPEGKISIELNREQKTLAIIDNGIGMTEAEVEKYIAQLAFSGAKDFVEKMKEQGTDDVADIIGKFGLGFYSTFMVADKVELESLSVEEGAKATKWVSAGESEYTFEETAWNQVGTKITLHINEESHEFLELFKTRGVLKNYCQFMPYPIELKDLNKKPEDKKEETADIINSTQPLWRKESNSLKDEDYKNFYRDLFPMDPEPLFWIHLNVDHPFTLQGILYFPKLNPNKPINESNIKLFSKQVFVSDNVKNVIPEFLGMLKGVIDSTDIPLNVSRSALQGDPNIRRLSNYVVKKVADALKKLFSTDRAKYESIWEDIGVFVKYGAMSETKFDELMRERIVFKNTDGKFVTAEEYQESIPEEFKEKLKGKIVYFEKEKSDANLRNMLKAKGVMAVEMDEYIDPHFMQHFEMKSMGTEGKEPLRFASLDAVFEELMSDDSNKEEDQKVQEVFNTVFKLGQDENKKDEKDATPDFGKTFDVEVKRLSGNSAPGYFKVDEQMKRFAQMTKTMGQTAFNMPIKKTLVVNPESPLIKKVMGLWKEDKCELAEKVCQHVRDLAQISSEGLSAEEREAFVSRSQDLINSLL